MPNFLGLYPMAPETDYAQQTVGINGETITELMRVVCYDQPIYDDMRLEGDEWLGLTLGVDRASIITTVRPMYDQAAILVQNDDSRLHSTICNTYQTCTVFFQVECVCVCVCVGV